MNDFNPDTPSQGLGDTIAKITHAVGLDKVADSVAKAMGKEDCGCNKRREALNKLIPYSQVTESEFQFTGDRTYEMLINLTVSRNGVSTRYTVGEQVVVNSDAPLYPYLKMLLSENKIKLI